MFKRVFGKKYIKSILFVLLNYFLNVLLGLLFYVGLKPAFYDHYQMFSFLNESLLNNFVKSLTFNGFLYFVVLFFIHVKLKLANFDINIFTDIVKL